MHDPFASFKAAQRAGWPLFAPLQSSTIQPAARLVRYAGIAPGQQVLDVACGTGVVAITAALAGANVTGLDLTPELLVRAGENAAIARLAIEWREGDAEALPFPDDSFDVVVSQFGHIFAPRPEVAVGEMLRVLRPGGTIAFASWPPEVFVGRMFLLVTEYLPLPPGVPSPAAWGDPAVVRARLGEAVRELMFDRDEVRVPALSPAHHRHNAELTAPPVARLVQALGTAEPAALERFRQAYEALAAVYFEGNTMRQDYLLVRAIKA